MSKTKITSEDLLRSLDKIYEKCLDGIPKISRPIAILSDEYMHKYKTIEKASKAMIKNQLIKCTTTGFLTGFGGLITLPITLPADITSVLYIQMRMIACLAYMNGYDLYSDQTQTFVYACIAGVSVNNIVKQFGVKFGNKFATNCIKKIPGKTISKINQKVGFRFITRFGEKGLINLGKMMPLVGAIISGTMDLTETKIIANRAYKWFIQNDFDSDRKKDLIIDIDDIENE